MLAALERVTLAATRALSVVGLVALMGLAAMTLADGLLRWVANHPIEGVRDLGGLAIAVAIAGLAGLHAGRIAGRRFSWLTAALVALWMFPMANVPFAWLIGVALALGTLDLFVRGLDSRRAAIGAGVALGVVSIFRHDLFAYLFLALGGLLVAVVLARRRSRSPLLGEVPPTTFVRPLLIAAATAIVLWVPVIVIGGLHNIWRDLVYNLYKYIMPARTLPFPNLLEMRSVPGLPVSLPAFLGSPFEGGIIVCFLAPVVGLYVLRSSWGMSRASATRAALVTILAVVTLPQMSGRTDHPHVLQSVPTALLVMGAAVEHMLRAEGSKVRLAAIAVFGLLLVPMTQMTMRFPVRVPRTAEFLMGSPREGGVPQPDAKIAQARRQVAALVSRNSAPRDPIYVGPSRHDRVDGVEMDLYFLLDRSGGTRYMQVDPNLTTRADVQQEMIADLETRKVCLAVLSDRLTVGPQRHVLPGSRLLDQYFAENFQPIGGQPPYVVLFAKRCRAPAGAPSPHAN